MKSFGMLVTAALMLTPVLGDDKISFYGLTLSSGGPRVSGVTRVTMSDFPWLSTRNVKSQEDLGNVIRRVVRHADGTSGFARPAIVYISDRKTNADAATLAQLDHFYFCQQDVKDRLEEYRWYWTYVESDAGRLLTKSYDLKHETALLIFEADGSVLHVESPITGPNSVARAMRMIVDKRRMEAAVKADLPFLRQEYSDGHFKTLVKYLLRTAKYEMYSTPWTSEKLSAMKRAVNYQGEEHIKRAEELASKGEREQALKILAAVERELDPLPPAGHAREVAKRIRREGS